MSVDLPDGARAVVLTASNRAAAGVYEDRSGRLLADGLADLGFAVDGPHVHPDDAARLEAALRAAVAGGADVVLTTGGTGLSPTDVTPEATRAVLEREAPGLAEALRRYGADKVPTAVLSRGLAGTAGRTLIVNLPGSSGGVKDGLTVLGPLLPHVVSQLRGGDHWQRTPRRRAGDWVVIGRDVGRRELAFQRAEHYVPPRWPDPAHPQQEHLDIRVDDVDAAEREVLAAGATRLPNDHEGGFRVFADPAGHPFCLVYG